MTDKELWCQMEQLASGEQALERDMSFMLLLNIRRLINISDKRDVKSILTN